MPVEVECEVRKETWEPALGYAPAIDNYHVFRSQTGVLVHGFELQEITDELSVVIPCVNHALYYQILAIRNDGEVMMLGTTSDPIPAPVPEPIGWSLLAVCVLALVLMGGALRKFIHKAFNGKGKRHGEDA